LPSHGYAEVGSDNRLADPTLAATHSPDHGPFAGWCLSLRSIFRHLISFEWQKIHLTS